MTTTSHYADLSRVLAEAGAGIDAAEAHGCLSGALCVDGQLHAAEWALEVLPVEDAEAVPMGSLDLFEEVLVTARAALDGDDLDFGPLLPSDQAPLADRVVALANWCGGFLYGLGRGGRVRQLPGDLDEITRDFAEISRAMLALEEGGEAAEQDYAELVEFVRASAQLAWEELRALRAGAGASSRTDH